MRCSACARHTRGEERDPQGWPSGPCERKCGEVFSQCRLHVAAAAVRRALIRVRCPSRARAHVVTRVVFVKNLKCGAKRRQSGRRRSH